MSVPIHSFTEQIIEILDKYSNNDGKKLLYSSEILQYINIKTKAANRGSKSRAAFGNHYAIYVLVEDYISGEFHLNGNYSDYEGAKFKDLLSRQRELPFGRKLQNHALNHRLNEDFKKYFPTCGSIPVIRDATSNRYWINEQLITLQGVNLAQAIVEIIDAYVEAKKQAFNDFMTYCQKIINIQQESPEKAIKFIKDLIHPNVDARIFEIVSFSVLKQHYAGQKIYWGWSPNELKEESLVLYKTGRTNANDGGIDFVMKPLGRFFQVTETIDIGKYFLDIDKVQRYPITFVIKTNESHDKVIAKIEAQAQAKYQIKAIVKKYIESIEEIINTAKLLELFENVLEQGLGSNIIEEIILQSKVEFHVETEQ